MAALKDECDRLAHKAGQRLALSSCGILVAYWYVVYRLTFETELGWGVVEPVTYLVGFSSFIGGYMWFWYYNREVSYRSALNLTISKRQSKLYEQKNFDLSRWEALIEEGNAVRKEIKAIAMEYDVE
jgi:calcium uniporter protein, mitochondrial